jgi:myo-inositol 2-dehydrogenase/D-chiro-inositol 1-dehydrogenase
MAEKPVRVGLIGTGRIGQVHARSIVTNPDTTLTWVADPFIEGAQKIAELSGAQPTDSPEELISSQEVDAVLIAAPTPTHVPLIDACVDARLPVLCEKPIDLDIARVEALRPKVQQSGVPVLIGFNRRFDPGFASARARLAAGEIGDLEHLSIISRDPSAPPAEYLKDSGGIFRDMTIHDFDMARFFDPEIVEVSATATTFFDPGAKEHGDYDSATTTLKTASGALISIINSRHSAIGYDQRMEVFGARGILQVANPDTSLVSVSTADAVRSRPRYGEFFLERYAEAYAIELNELVKAARGQDFTAPTFEDGRAALILADAAMRSAHEGIAVPVELRR